MHYFINNYSAQHNVPLDNITTADWFISDMLTRQRDTNQTIQLPTWAYLIDNWHAGLDNLTAISDQVVRDAPQYQIETKADIQARLLAPFRNESGSSGRQAFLRHSYDLHQKVNPGLDQQYFAQFPRVLKEYTPKLAAHESALSQDQPTITALDRVRQFRRIALSLKAYTTHLLARTWPMPDDVTFELLGLQSGEWLICCKVENRVLLFPARSDDAIRCLVSEHVPRIPSTTISAIKMYLASLRQQGANAQRERQLTKRQAKSDKKYRFIFRVESVEDQRNGPLTSYVENQWRDALTADLLAQKTAGHTANTHEQFLNWALPFYEAYQRKQNDPTYELSPSTVVVQSLKLASYLAIFAPLGAKAAEKMGSTVFAAFTRARFLKLSRSASYRLMSARARPWLSQSVSQQAFLETYRTSATRANLPHLYNYIAKRAPANIAVRPALSRPARPLSTLRRAASLNPVPTLSMEELIMQLLKSRMRRIPEAFASCLEQCARAVEAIQTAHRAEPGIFGLRTRLIMMWETAEDQMPMNHFVSVFTHQGAEYIVDPTAGQFLPWEGLGLQVFTERQWLHDFAAVCDGRLTAFRDFKDVSKAEQVSGRLLFLQYPEAIALLDEPFMLNTPAWAPEFPAAKS